MQQAGARGIATGRQWIADSGVMLRLLQYAAMLDLVVVTHAEDGRSSRAEAGATAGENIRDAAGACRPRRPRLEPHVPLARDESRCGHELAGGKAAISDQVNDRARAFLLVPRRPKGAGAAPLPRDQRRRIFMLSEPCDRRLIRTFTRISARPCDSEAEPAGQH